jgi:hypothetical protein
VENGFGNAPHPALLREVSSITWKTTLLKEETGNRKPIAKRIIRWHLHVNENSEEN